MIFEYINCPNLSCSNILSVPSKRESGTIIICNECGYKKLYIDKQTYKDNKKLIKSHLSKKQIKFI